MKKKLLFALMTGIVLATSTVVTSCGGSNDDDTDNVEQDTPGVLGYKYVQPCVQWNATQDEVATYMSGIGGWSMKTRQAQAEIWMCSNPTTEITYVYGVGLGITGLYSAQVTYYSGKESEFADLRKNIESAHGCTLQMNETNVNTYTAEDVKINGRKTNITVRSYNDGTTSFMSVMYSLSY